MSLTLMPFGKYKNTPIDELGDNYLYWISTAYAHSDPQLEMLLKEELDDRIKSGIYSGRCTAGIDERSKITTYQFRLLLQINSCGGLRIGDRKPGSAIEELYARGFIAKTLSGITQFWHITSAGRSLVEAESKLLGRRNSGGNPSDCPCDEV